MKTVLSGIACAIFCHTGTAQEITVHGKITDADTVMVILSGMEKADTVMTNNGYFSFKRKQQYPQFYSLIFVKNQQSIEAIKEGNERKMRSREDGTYISLFLQNGSVTLRSKFSGIRNTIPVISNHSLQDKYISFSKRFDPLVKMARSIIDSSFTPNRTKEEKKLFTNLYNRVCEIENDVAENFIKENTNNTVGAYILYRYLRLENYDKLNNIYNSFSKELKSTGYLQNIQKKLTALSKLQADKKAIDFTAKTADNTSIRLSDFKGRYVVLDFWGSWCQPCMKGLPKMKEYYHKYKNDLVLIGIACKDKETDWRNTMARYQINWPSILNHAGETDLSVKYNIEAYPTKILIDRNGNFIEAFVGESESFYQKLDSLFMH